MKNHMIPGDEPGTHYCGASDADGSRVTMWAAVTCRACVSRWLRDSIHDRWLNGHEKEATIRVALRDFVAIVDDVASIEWNSPDLTIRYGSGVPPTDMTTLVAALAELRTGLHDGPPLYFEVSR